MKEIMLAAASTPRSMVDNLVDVSDWPDFLFYIGQDCTDDETLVTTLTIDVVVKAIQTVYEVDMAANLSQFWSKIYGNKF